MSWARPSRSPIASRSASTPCECSRTKWPSIIDAIEPGGSGEPYHGLNDEERGALEETTRRGSRPGRSSTTSPGWCFVLFANFITSGAAAGKTASCLGYVALGRPGQVGLASDSVGDTIDITAGRGVVEAIEVGDEVRIDNLRFLALQTYHRHQLPPHKSRLRLPRRLRLLPHPDGTPKYPRRGVDIGAAGTLGSTGQIPTGRFNGKMIVVECLHDGDALPWQATGTEKKVEAVEGPHAEEKYRLWSVDNANHTDPTTEIQQTHAIAYSGTVQYV